MISKWEKEGIRAGEYTVLEGNIVVTRNADVANIAILPLEGESCKMKIFCGQTEPQVRGFTALYGKIPSYDISYTIAQKLPSSMTSILYPLRPNESEVPHLVNVAVSSKDGTPVIGMMLESEKWTDLVLMLDGKSGELSYGEVRFLGEILWVRSDYKGKWIEARMFNAKLLSLNGKCIYESEKTVRSKCINFA